MPLWYALSALAADAPIDRELPYGDATRPAPPEVAARLTADLGTLDPEARVKAANVLGWCLAAFPETTGRFDWSATVGGWLPETTTDRGRPLAVEFDACAFAGLHTRVPAKGRVQVVIAEAP